MTRFQNIYVCKRKKNLQNTTKFDDLFHWNEILLCAVHTKFDSRVKENPLLNFNNVEKMCRQMPLSSCMPWFSLYHQHFDLKKNKYTYMIIIIIAYITRLIMTFEMYTFAPRILTQQYYVWWYDCTQYLPCIGFMLTGFDKMVTYLL